MPDLLPRGEEAMLLCHLPEHLSHPATEGTVTLVCDSCGSDVVAAPSAVTLKQRLLDRDNTVMVMCCCCSGYHSIDDVMNDVGNEELSFHVTHEFDSDDPGDRCNGCGIPRGQLRKEWGGRVD